jgi:hypothetical protein
MAVAVAQPAACKHLCFRLVFMGMCFSYKFLGPSTLLICWSLPNSLIRSFPLPPHLASTIVNFSRHLVSNPLA